MSLSIPELGSSLPEVAFRSVVVYLFVIVGLRIGGKREVGQLSVPDLAVLLLISNAVQNAMVGDNQSVLGGIVGGAAILLVSKVLGTESRRNSWFRRAVRGEPAVLMANGRLNKDLMCRENVTASDLAAAIRARGLSGRRQVRMAVLEVDGSISIIEKREERTPAHRPRRAGRVGAPENRD